MTTAETAIAWLSRELQDGLPHAAGGVLTRGTEAGYSELALRRAARSLGVKYSEASLGAKATAPKILIWKLAAAREGAHAMNTPGQKPARRVKSRRTLNGWVIEADSGSWSDLMSALTIAIDACRNEPDRAMVYRELRSAISRG